MKSRKSVAGSCIASAIAMAFSSGAHALDFQFGDGWRGSWQNTVSLGTAWRAGNADKDLYSAADGARAGLSGGRAPNTIDEGNVNYRKGDRFTTLFKWMTEVQVQKGDMGALVRAKAWYDYTLNHEDVRYGNQNNGYRNKPLKDNGFETLNRFDGVYLLDAYVYNTWDIAGKPMQARLGNQVVNWGESLFIQGLNQINPIDVPSFHKPGAQLKEVFLPVPIAYANQSLGSLGNLELFYQLRYKNTPLDVGCGNYWSLAASNISRKPGACDNGISMDPVNPGQHGGMVNGAYIHAINADKPSNSGQFGASWRFEVDALDTEFGIYGMRYHSRTPVVSIDNLANGRAQNGMPFDIKWEYPEAIKAFGVSAATNILGWSVAGELSQRRGVPVQVDGNDLLMSGLGAAGGIVPGVSIPFGPYGSSAVAAAANNGGSGYLAGYKRANITQLQLNTVKAGNRVLGGDQYVFVAEVGAQWNNLPKYKSNADAVRFGRDFIFGTSYSPHYFNDCPGANSKASCANDGFKSRFAWGYRAKLDVTYNDVFAGVGITPSVFWSHDVKGYAADGQFIEDRMALGLGVKFSYGKQYTLDLGATMYNRDAKYDPLRDRAFYSATLSASF